MKITITPKDPELAKSKAVKKYFAHLSKAISKHLTDQKFDEKVFEAAGLGVPLLMTKDGAIQVVEDFYTIAPKYRTKEYLKGLIYPATKGYNPNKWPTLNQGMPPLPLTIQELASRTQRDPSIMDKIDWKKVDIEKKHAGENCLTCTRTEKTKCFCCARRWDKKTGKSIPTIKRTWVHKFYRHRLIFAGTRRS